MSINIIGLAGQKFAGKDTTAKIIQFFMSPEYKDGWRNFNNWLEAVDGSPYNTEWKTKAYADSLRDIYSSLTGVPVMDLLDRKEKEKHRADMCAVADKIREWKTTAFVDALWNHYKPSKNWTNGGRLVLQTTEFRPEAIEPSGYKYPKWIITDVRYPKIEAVPIKERGGIVVRIDRDTDTVLRGKGIHIPEKMFKHSSETSLDGWTYDWVIENNGTIEDLVKEVKVMLTHFGIINNKIQIGYANNIDHIIPIYMERDAPSNNNT